MYLPGQTSLPPVDRDECRFAQASRQMFEGVALPAGERDAKMHSGGLVVPMLVDVPRLNKPPLIYWLQSASAALFTWGKPLDDAIWMYRVPSVLGAIVAAFATWRLGLKMFDARAALLAAMLLAVAPMVVWDAHQARADQLLLACTTVCMGALWSVWKASRHVGTQARAEDGAPAPRLASAQSPVPSAFLFWLALGAGIMAKGPVTPLVAGLAVLWLSFTTRSWRWLRDLRPVMGAGIVLACVAPWVWAVAQRQGGLGPYAQLVWDEFFARGLRGSKEGHFAPPGTHTVLLAALFWPGSLLTLAGFVAAWKRARGTTSPTRERGGTIPPPVSGSGDRRGRTGWKPVPRHLARAWRGRDAEMFLIAWIVPMWVVFELSLAKLPHYTMPIYPAIALVSARMVCRWDVGRVVAQDVGIFAWGLIGSLLAGTVLVIVRLRANEAALSEAPWMGIDLNVTLVVLAVGAAWFVALLWAVRCCNTGRWLRGQCVAALLCVPFGAAAIGVCAPWLAPGAETARLVAAAERLAPGRPMLTVAPFIEASMTFATRGRWIPSDPATFAAAAQSQPAPVVVLAPDQLDAARVSGFKIAPGWLLVKGTRLHLGTVP